MSNSQIPAVSVEKQSPVYEIDGGSRNLLSEAMLDMHEGLNNHRLWRQLAKIDIQQRYHGSRLGPFWITATSGIFAVGIGLVYSQIFQIALADYIPFVGIGIVLWGAIISVMTEGTQIFIAAGGIIKQLRMPLSLFLFRLMYRNVISFGYRAIVIVVLMLVMQVPVTRAMPLALVGVMLFFLVAIWAVLLIAILSIRFRDIIPLTSMLLTFSFFMTPIFWKPSRLGEYEWLMNFNPFYHFMVIIRQPLLGTVPSAVHYIMAVGLIVILAISSLWLFAYTRRSIPFWT